MHWQALLLCPHPASVSAVTTVANKRTMQRA
jgi:hypothetical protein